MPRRPGPPPKEPSTRVRRNKDTTVSAPAKPRTLKAAPGPTKSIARKPTTRAARAAARQTPVVDGDGWTSIPPGARTAKPPAISAWLSIGFTAEEAYAEFAKLPQAKAWLESEWKLLQLSLPLLERYVARPGSESFKALVSALGPALKLTSDDLAKARMRIAVPEPAETATTASAGVTDINARRDRLTS